jgi:hypothetical protein
VLPNPKPRWSIAPGIDPARFALSHHAVQLRVRLLAAPARAAGHRSVAVTLASRPIARAELPESLVPQLAAVLRQPVRLLIELEPWRIGLHVKLYVVTETRSAARALGIPQASCWRAPRVVSVPIGASSLTHTERRHPLDLRAEAEDQLRRLMVFPMPS